jgi:hypothetical protein
MLKVLRCIVLLCLGGSACAAESFNISVITADEQLFEAAKMAVMALPGQKFRGLNIQVGWVSTTRPEAAEYSVRMALDIDRTAVIIGGDTVASQRAILKALRGKRQVPFISLADFPPDQEERLPHFYRVGPNRGHLLVALEDALRTMKISRLLLLADASATAANDTVRRSLPKLRVEIISPHALMQQKSDDAALFIPWTSMNWLREQRELWPALQGIPIFVEGHAVNIVPESGLNLITLNTFDSADRNGPLKTEYGIRAFAATQLVLAALEDASYRQKRDVGAFGKALGTRPIDTALGRMDFRGGGECAALNVAAIRLADHALLSRTKGAACKCVDEACCKNCCTAKSRSCINGSCE